MNGGGGGGGGAGGGGGPAGGRAPGRASADGRRRDPHRESRQLAGSRHRGARVQRAVYEGERRGHPRCPKAAGRGGGTPGGTRLGGRTGGTTADGRGSAVQRRNHGVHPHGPRPEGSP